MELWDVSGDRRFDSGWAAIHKDAVGVVIVFDGDDREQERTVPSWFVMFQSVYHPVPPCARRHAGLVMANSTLSVTRFVVCDSCAAGLVGLSSHKALKSVSVL